MCAYPSGGGISSTDTDCYGKRTTSLQIFALTTRLPASTAVGLSYSKVDTDYTTNDTATAHDSNHFLRKFFKRYPELQENDFFISGESSTLNLPEVCQEAQREPPSSPLEG